MSLFTKTQPRFNTSTIDVRHLSTPMVSATMSYTELLTCTVHHNLTCIVYRSGDNGRQRDKYLNFCPRDKERKRRKSKDMLHELGSFPRVTSPDSPSMDRGAVGGLRPPSEAASDSSGVSPADGFTSPVHSMATSSSSKMTTTHHGNTRARMLLAQSPCVEAVMCGWHIVHVFVYRCSHMCL